jgi:hypothetical protein
MLIYERKNTLYVLLLFPVAVANRESAIIFGSWYLIEAGTNRLMRVAQRINYPRLFLGIGLIAVTIIYTKLARDLLFHPVSSNDTATSHEQLGNHFTLLNNIILLTPQGLVGKTWFAAIAAYLYVYTRYAFGRNDPFGVAFGLLQVWVLIQIAVFAVIGETRVFYTLLPMIFVSFLNCSWKSGTLVFVPRAATKKSS